jgi:hypothetical protein
MKLNGTKSALDIGTLLVLLFNSFSLELYPLASEVVVILTWNEIPNKDHLNRLALQRQEAQARGPTKNRDPSPSNASAISEIAYSLFVLISIGLQILHYLSVLALDDKCPLGFLLYLFASGTEPVIFSAVKYGATLPFVFSVHDPNLVLGSSPK